MSRKVFATAGRGGGGVAREMQCKPPADAFDVSFAAACDAMQNET
jgi:hypothetical protein